MNDYLGISVLIIALIISVLIAKKDFRKWGELEPKDKMYTLRPLILIVLGIILLIYQKIKSH